MPDDYEKFEAWAATMPKLAGSPLYSWSHLELQRFFQVTEPLSPATCKKNLGTLQQRFKGFACKGNDQALQRRGHHHHG